MYAFRTEREINYTIFVFVKFLVILISILISTLILAQPGNDNCTSATILCGNQPTLANNNGATVSACAGCSDGSSVTGNFCFALNNTTWFKFTTNEVGGDVNVDFSNINCTNDPTYDNELQAVVISASVPCDESTYTPVSNCISNSAIDFTLIATALDPNTTYYILVDGDLNGPGITNPSECFFNITTTGNGVTNTVYAGEDITVENGESTTIEGSAPAGFEWSPPNYLSNTTSLTTVSTPQETITYYLSYTASNGCIYQDEITVSVFEPITIPNTITPNNDGINDTWKIGRIDNYPGAEVTVYDRWGQIVFNTIGYTDSRRWDGSREGNRLPSGTYFYSIDLKTGSENNLFFGPITIIH